MPIDELKDQIKADEHILKSLIADYWGENLQRVGIDRYRCLCHFHPDQNNPNFYIYKKDGEWRFKCFACGESGDAISFVQKIENCDFIEALKLIAERFSLPFLEELETHRSKNKVKPASSEKKEEGAPPPFEWIVDRALLPEVEEYLKIRHIKPELVKEKVYSLKRTSWTERDYERGYFLVVPAIYPKKQNEKVIYELVGVRLRNVKGQLPKSKSLKGYRQFPFGLENITEETKEVLIVEGEIDYLTLYAFLKNAQLDKEIAVVGLPFARYRFPDDVKELLPGRVVIIPDNDPVGKDGAKELAKSLFREREVFIAELPQGIKDVNELMESSEGDYSRFASSLKAVIDGAYIRGPYSPISSPREHIALVISESKNKEETQKRVIPTGIKWIDELLNGGIRRGFYGLAGQPAIGKTSFCLALSRHLVNNGIKVLFFSLEMTIEDLTAQLVDWELGIPKYKYLDRRLNEWDIRKLSEAVSFPVFNDLKIDDEAESISDIEERLNLFVNENEGNPVVVFVDYLQRVTPRERKRDARLEASSVAYDLKRIANKFQVPVIAISSVSREGYRDRKDSKSKSKKNPLTAFKESGDIEYSLYAGFFLDYPDEEELSQYPLLEEWHLPIKIILVKNRFGKARDSKTGEFISKFCYLDFKKGKLFDVEEVEDVVDF